MERTHRFLTVSQNSYKVHLIITLISLYGCHVCTEYSLVPIVTTTTISVAIPLILEMKIDQKFLTVMYCDKLGNIAIISLLFIFSQNNLKIYMANCVLLILYLHSINVLIFINLVQKCMTKRYLNVCFSAIYFMKIVCIYFR